MSIGIYKITNKLNNHSYIGQSINIEQRWYHHKYSYNNINNPGYYYTLYRAFRKYGIENFNFEILELCTEEELNDKEIYWIDYYNSYLNGYNDTPGGDSGPSLPGELNPNSKLTEVDVYKIRQAVLQCLPQKQFYQENKFDQLISYRQFCRIWRGEGWTNVLPEAIEFVKTQEYLSQIRRNARAAANSQEQIEAWEDIKQRKIAGQSRHYVYQLYKEKYTPSGFDSIWYKIKENTKPLRREVIKIDINTNLPIEIYESAAEAGRQNDCDASSITKVCKGHKKTCKGFKWRYKNDNLC